MTTIKPEQPAKNPCLHCGHGRGWHFMNPNHVSYLACNHDGMERDQGGNWPVCRCPGYERRTAKAARAMLYGMLQDDIYTDAPEYADRIERIFELLPLALGERKKGGAE